MPIWRGTTNSNWSTGSNWDTGVVPTNATDAIFSSSFNVACVVDGTAATVRDCANLTITSGYTSNITLSGSIRSGLSTTGGITINGTPTFLLGTASGSLILNGSSLNRSISSSANIIIPRFTEVITNATLSTSGSVVCNNIQFDHGGSTLIIAGPGFTASNGTISGTGTSVVASGTPELLLSGSINWNYASASLPLNIIIGNNCNFTQSSSLNISNRTLFVSSSATLNCSASSFVQFTGTCTMSMDNSTTNRFNSLRLSNAGLRLNSDVYLMQNTGSLSTTTLIGHLYWEGANSTLTGNRIIYVGGNLGFSGGTANQPLTSTAYSAGGSKIVLYGTGYINVLNGNLVTYLDIDISSSYNIGIGNPSTTTTWLLDNKTYTYITASSLPNYSNSTVLLVGGSVQIDFKGQAIFNLSHNSSGTGATLLSNLVCSGSYVGTGGTNGINGSTLEVQRNLTSPFNGVITGTTNLLIGGNTPTTYSAVVTTNNITINKTSGGSVLLSNVSGLAAGLQYQGGTFTYTAGTINPGTSTMTLGTATATSTLNNMTWYNLTVPGTNTVTMNVSNTIQNNLTLAATNNVTFTGSAGWTCANLLCSTAGRIITLANSSSGASYRTTTNANLLGTAASPVSMSSNNATTRSLWTLDNGAAQSLVYVNGTRIDSSQGATVWSFGGLLTNTVNWGSGSAPATTAYTYVC